MLINKMTNYLMLVASSIDNYCKYLKRDINDYSSILGYVFRAHPDKIKGISPQGIGLLIMYLKDVNEDDYGKHIDCYKDKVDNIIKESKDLDEQFKRMDKIKKSIK